jgi:hypothetical protein
MAKSKKVVKVKAAKLKTGKGSGKKRGSYKKKIEAPVTTKLVVKKAATAVKTSVPILIQVYKVTKTIAELRTNCLKIGDSQYKKYVETGDVGHAAAALAGYKLGINATQTQLTYQKITGRINKIKFCEE